MGRYWCGRRGRAVGNAIPFRGVVCSHTAFCRVADQKHHDKAKRKEYFEQKFIPKFNNVTVIGLLLTLIIIFSFQGRTIIEKPVDIILIAIPLTIQTFLIFFIAYIWSKLWKLPHNIASPAAMIGASNFFELAVAVAISVFGLKSPAALATIVGVLVEVPVMLALVRIANKTRNWFPQPDDKSQIAENKEAIPENEVEE